MSKLIRCPRCRGKKMLMGAGLIMKDCQYCDAIGWVNAPEEAEQKLSEAIADVVKEEIGVIAHAVEESLNLENKEQLVKRERKKKQLEAIPDDAKTI